MVDIGRFPGSDHNALTWRLHVNTTYNKSNRVQQLNYSKADVIGMKQDLCKIDWHNLLRDLTVEQSWQALKEILAEWNESTFQPRNISRTAVNLSG